MKAPESKASRFIARAAWIIPAAVLALTIHQVRVALDLGTTLGQGEAAQAEVLRYFRSDRKDVTHAEVDLRVVLEDGTERTWEALALPYSIAHRIDSADSVAVRVNLDGGQEVVIEAIGSTQQRIALYNAAMAAVIFLITLVGVWAWNRWISRRPEEGGGGRGPGSLMRRRRGGAGPHRPT